MECLWNRWNLVQWTYRLIEETLPSPWMIQESIEFVSTFASESTSHNVTATVVAVGKIGSERASERAFPLRDRPSWFITTTPTREQPPPPS